jgi:hypothetical protein
VLIDGGIAVQRDQANKTLSHLKIKKAKIDGGRQGPVT